MGRGRAIYDEHLARVRIRLMTPKELALYLQCSEATIKSLTNRREIPYIKVGSRVRYDPDVVVQWVEQHTIQPLDL